LGVFFPQTLRRALNTGARLFLRRLEFVREKWNPVFPKRQTTISSASSPRFFVPETAHSAIFAQRLAKN
jgi:hypothetical protein